MSQQPYPGLRAFERDEVDIFFGRQPHTLQLLQRLHESPFLAVIGPSGYGKSSLVRTGLLAALETGFLPQAGVHWQVALLRPTNQPFVNLAMGLLAEPVFAETFAQVTSFTDDMQAVQVLTTILQRGPGSLLELLDNLALPPQTNVMLVVDQFEEIFRYYAQGAADQASAFVQFLLQTAVIDPNGVSVYVVLTMRSDFLGDCAVFEGLPEAINQGLFLVPRLTREQLALAIARPAEVFGGAVSPALLNALLNDVGDNPDQLPVLQHALMRMWGLAEGEAAAGSSPLMSLDHYQRIGGLRAALSNHADEVLFSLTTAQQRIAEVLFKCLTERGTGERDTRRPVLLREVVDLVVSPAPAANVPSVAPTSASHAPASSDVPAPVWDDIITVIEAFRAPGRHFITPSQRKELHLESVLDITHESIIRQWRRLQEWVAQEAENGDLYQRLVDATERYAAGRVGLWRTPELEHALAWRENFQPTAVWARRYGGTDAGGAFTRAMAFLDESAAAQVAEQWRQRGRQVVMGMLVVVVGLLGLAGWQWWVAEGAKQEAVRTRSLYLADLSEQQLEQELTYTGTRLALAALKDSANLDPPVVDNAQQVLFNALQQPLVMEHYDSVNFATFNPQGDQILTVSDDHTARLWDGYTKQPLAVLLGHDAAVTHGVYSPDGQYIVTVSADHTARLWSVAAVLEAGEATEAIAVLRGHEKPVNKVAYRPDGEQIATVASDNTVRLWAVPSGQLLKALTEHQDAVTQVSYSPDGSAFLTASDDDTARLWAADTGEVLAVLEGHAGDVKEAIYRPDGKQVLTLSSTNVMLWEAGSGTFQFKLAEEDVGEFVSAAYSPDSKNLVTGSTEKVFLWDAYTGNKIDVLDKYYSTTGHQVFYSTDGNSIIGTYSNELVLWEVSSKKIIQGRNYSSSINHIVYSPDGKRIVTVLDNKIATLSEFNKNTSSFEASRDDNILQVGVGNVTYVGYSSDRQYMLALSKENRVQWWDANNHNPLVSLQGHESQVYKITYSPDGSQLVTVGNDGMQLWNPDTGESSVLLSDDAKTTVTHVAYSPDSRQLVTVHEDNNARLWNAATGERLAVLQTYVEYGINHVAYSRDSRQLLISPWGINNMVQLWDTQTGKMLKALKGHTEWSMNHATYSLDGKQLATVADDDTIRLWDANTYKPLDVLDTHKDAVYHIAYHPNGKQFATASADNTVRLWDANNYEELAVLKGHEAEVVKTSYSPDGTQLVAMFGGEKILEVWDTHSYKPVFVIKGHTDTVNHAVYSPDGQQLVTVSNDNTLRIWETKDYTELAVLRSHHSNVTDVAYHPDGQQFATASHDGTTRIWDAQTYAQLFVLNHPSYVTRTKYSDESKGNEVKISWDADKAPSLAMLNAYGLAVTSAAFAARPIVMSRPSENVVRLWDANSGQSLALLRGHKDTVNSANYSPDANYIVTASDDKTARIWKAETGEQLRILEWHEEAVSHAIYSPDGLYIVTTSQDKTARLWEAATGKMLHKLVGHTERVNHAAYSPDGEQIATASNDNTVRLWNANTTELLATLEGHATSVAYVGYSADGEHILTGARDGSARVWNIASGKTLLILPQHGSAVNHVTYSPDRQHIVTAANNGTVRLWRIYDDLAQMTAEAQHRLRLHPALSCQQKRDFFLLKSGETCEGLGVFEKESKR